VANVTLAAWMFLCRKFYSNLKVTIMATLNFARNLITRGVARVGVAGSTIGIRAMRTVRSASGSPGKFEPRTRKDQFLYGLLV
jgi:hypothetical protein